MHREGAVRVCIVVLSGSVHSFYFSVFAHLHFLISSNICTTSVLRSYFLFKWGGAKTIANNASEPSNMRK